MFCRFFKNNGYIKNNCFNYSEWNKFCDIILNEFPFLDIFFNALKTDVI